MKLGKIIGMSVLSLSLLGLGACGTSQTTQSVSKHTTGSGNSSSTSEKGKSSSDTNATDDNNSSSTSDSGKSSTSGDSNQSSSGVKTSRPITTHQTKPSPPPKTQKQAVADLVNALSTKVPVMLPTSVPVSKGKYLTGTTYSETWYYKTNLYETAHPASINSSAASRGIWIAAVEGTEYKDEASAKKSINGYTKVDSTQNPNIDLGHGIKGIENAGLGHAYIIWNEGRWCINMDSPNDPTYNNKKYPDSIKLAQDVVSFLNQNVLPAPQSLGVITINNWNKSYGTTITWQNHKMTYQVTSQDPFVALKVAVAMHFMSK
jgi:hypothetical protein